MKVELTGFAEGWVQDINDDRVWGPEYLEGWSFHFLDGMILKEAYGVAE